MVDHNTDANHGSHDHGSHYSITQNTNVVYFYFYH